MSNGHVRPANRVRRWRYLAGVIVVGVLALAAGCTDGDPGPELATEAQEVCGTVGCACAASTDCNDNNSCTTDSCGTSGSTKNKCKFTAVANGTACAGGTCQAGVCAVTCTPSCAGKVCGDDGCGGTCGTCGGTGACAGTCNPGGTACTFPVATTCDDGNACTAGETCDGAGSCAASSTITACTSGDLCCATGCGATTDADCSLPVTAQTAVSGTVSGTFTSTATADGVAQAITEVLLGSGQNKYSGLEFKWQIGAIPAPGPWRLVLDGKQNGSTDLDSFQFAASNDGTTWADVALAVPPAATSYARFESPVAVTGTTLHVRVKDTDRVVGHNNLDTISVDRLALAFGGADLIATSLTAPATAAPNQPVALSWGVTNRGGGDAKGAYACCASGAYYYRWADVVYLSTDAVLSADDLEVGRQYTADQYTLTPSASYTGSATMTIPSVAGGAYYLIVAPDGIGNRVVEQSDVNGRVAVPITITPANLAVTAYAAPPSAGAGELIALSWTVQNQGTGVAAASYLGCCAEGYYNKWADAVYLSTDAVLSADDLEAGRVWRSNGYTLSAGSSYTQTATFAVPVAAPGAYYLLFVPDAIGQRVVETNEANTYAVPLTVGRADLVATSLGAPATAAARELLALSWTVTNQGTGGASGRYQACCTDYYYKWADAVYLSTDATLSADDVELGRVWRGDGTVVGVGGSYTVSTQAQLPDVAAGSYYLVLAPDAVGNRVLETSDGNNPLAVAITIGAADLVVTQLSAPPQAGVQELVSLAFTVANHGSGGASGRYQACCTDYYYKWADAVYLSTDATLDAGDLEMGRIWRGDGFTLAAGSTYTVETALQLPVVPAGSYYLIAAADTVGDRVLEASDANSVAVPIVVRQADLVTQAVVAPSSAGSQGLIDVAWVVANQGGGGASGRYLPCCTDYYYKWADAVYLSTDATLDAGDQELARLWRGDGYTLQAGATYTQTASVQLPAVAAGSYHLLVVADAINDRVHEADASNNVRAVPLTVGTADLVVSALTGPTSVGAQSSATVTWIVTNQGSAAASGKYVPCCTDYYYKWADVAFLSTDATLDAGDVELGRSWRGDQFRLAAGESYQASATFDLPVVADGAYYLIMVADGAADRVREVSDGNNTRALAIAVGRSDAAVTSLAAPARAAAGQVISATFTIANQGTAPAIGRYLPCCTNYYRKWADALYLSTDATLDAGDTALATYWRGDGAALAAGGTYAISATVTLPTVANGAYYLLAAADVVADRLYESNEANNVRAQAITIGQDPPAGAANLVVQALGVPANAGAQELITLAWTVRNLGTTTATASTVACCAEGYYNKWADVAYLSTDATLDAGDLEFGRVYTANGFTLAGGATYATTAQLQLPNVAAGAYYVILATDGVNNRAAETSDTDNRLAMPITIGVADLDPVALTAPATAGAHELITVAWQIKNAGTGAAAGKYLACCATGYYYKWADALYLSTDATLSADDLLVTTSWTADQFRVAAGGTYTTQLDVQLPSVAPGAYYLVLATDNVGDRVAESDASNNVQVAPIAIARPDLVARDLAGPSAVAVQELATFSWRVDNPGAGGATGKYLGCCATGYYYKWADALYLSTDATLSADDVAIGTAWRADQYTLAAGGSYTASLAVQIPQVASGAYYVLVATDGTGARVDETDETNNAAALPITVGVADLVAKSFVAPAAAAAQELVSLSWTVSNDGNRAATGKYQACCAEGYYYRFADQVYLSTDGALSADDVVVGRVWRADQFALAAGSAYTETASFQLPVVADGSYHLILVADGFGDRVYETSESNNARAVPITIGRADLVATSFTAPAQAAAQELVSLSWTVANQGTGGASGKYVACCAEGYYYRWADRVYLSTDAALSADDVAVGTTWRADQYKLPAGTSATASATMALPAVAPGAYYLLLVADAVGDRVLEQSEANNVIARPIAMGKADLVASAVSAPASAGAQELVAVSFTVANAGSAAAAGKYVACCATGYYYKWADVVYLSTDAALSADDVVVGTVWRGDQFALGASASYTVNTTMAMPAVPGGAYHLILATDAVGDRVTELSEGNNTTATPITIGSADLAVTAATAPASAGAQELVPLTWTVTNQGAGGASGKYQGCCAEGYYNKWADVVYLSTDGTLGADDVEVGRVWRPDAYTLAPGVSYTASTTMQLPAVAPGAYQLLVVPDAIGNRVAELDDTDLRAVPITLAKADLVVSATTAPASAGVSELVAVAWTVTNQGAGGASGKYQGCCAEGYYNKWADVVYLSTDAALSADDVEVGRVWRADQTVLAAGGSYAVTTTVQLPAVAGGAYQLLVVADALGDRVFETSDSNNLRATPISLARPDLQIATFAAPASGAAQELVAMSWTVGNQGGGAATGKYQGCCAEGYYYRWADAVYLSTDATLSADDVKLGQVYRADAFALAAAATYTVTANLALPVVAPGSYQLILVADGVGDRVAEGVETNNTVSRAITVTRADLALTAFSGPGSAGSGQLVSFSWTVTNPGTGGASGKYQGCCAAGYYYKWADRIVLSRDATASADDVVVGTDWRAEGFTLPAGGSYTTTVSLPMPEVDGGAYYLVLTTDAVGDRVYELDASNNTRTLPITMARTVRSDAVSTLEIPAGAAEYMGSPSFSPDGAWLAATDGNRAGIWDIGTGGVRGMFTAHTAPLTAVRFSPIGDQLLSAAQDGTVRIWDSATYQQRKSFAQPITGDNPAVYSHDGSTVLAASGTTARLWNVATSAQQGAVDHGATVDAVAISTDGTRALTGGTDGTARLWNLQTFALVATLTGHTGAVTAVGFSPSGAELMTAGADGTIRLWSAASATQTAIMQQGYAVTAAAFSSDGLYVVSGNGLDWGNAYLWERTGLLVATFHIPVLENIRQVLTGVTLSPDRTTLAATYRENDWRQVTNGNLYTWPTGLPAIPIVPAVTVAVGSSYPFTIQPNGRYLFRVDVPTAGAGMFFNLAGVASADITYAGAAGDATTALQMYAALGQPPSAGTHDDAADAVAAALAAEIPVSPVPAGTYYVLVTAPLLTGGSIAATLQVGNDPYRLSATPARRAGNAGRATIKIRGTGLEPNSEVVLVAPGGALVQPYYASWRSPTTMFATFDLAGATLGAYGLRVTRTSDAAARTRTGVVAVSAGTGSNLAIAITGPSVVRMDRPYEYSLTFENTGDADATSPFIMVTPIGPGQLYSAGGTTRITGPRAWLAGVPGWPANVIPAGTRGTIKFKAYWTEICNYELHWNQILEGPEAFDWTQVETRMGVMTPAQQTAWDKGKGILGSTNEEVLGMMRIAATYATDGGIDFDHLLRLSMGLAVQDAYFVE